MDIIPYIAAAFEAIFSREFPSALLEASEGDARRYMKKAIEAAGLTADLARDYGVEWVTEAFNTIRSDFCHRGCDVYFIPGLARILYGELGYDSDEQDTGKVDELRELVRFITTAHRNEFTRNLERITVVQDGPKKGMKVRSDPMTFGQLHEMFSREQREVTDSEREEFEKSGATPTGYDIIELTDFETAHKYLQYTNPASPWCYFEDADTFEDYASSGNRLYLALKPGFEQLEPGDPGYGRSMIGFDMGPVQKDGTSRMLVCTNRYNHGENLEHEEGAGTGDSAYDETQLSRILGIPVWKACPGYSIDELVAHGRFSIDILRALIPDAGKFREVYDRLEEFNRKYRAHAERSGIVHETNALVFFNSRGNSVAWVFADPDTDRLVWTETVGYLPEGKLVVVDKDNGVRMVDRDGHALSRERLDIIDNAEKEFPVSVAKRGEGRDFLWNYMDADGNMLLDEWLLGADRFRDGLARVRFPDKTMGIIDRDMKVLVSGASRIDLISRGRMLVEKDSRTNIFSVKDGFRFDPWLDLFKVSPNWPCTVAVISQEGRFNLYDLSTDFLYPNWYFDISMNDVKAGGKFLVLVQRDDRKYNYVVVPESAQFTEIPPDKMGQPVLDEWADAADLPENEYSEDSHIRWHHLAANFMYGKERYRVRFDGEIAQVRPKSGQDEWKTVWTV